MRDCVAVCSSLLQSVAVCSSLLHSVLDCLLQSFAVLKASDSRYTLWQCVAVRCSVLQY